MFGFAHFWETPLHREQNFCGVVHGQGGLCHHCQFFFLGNLQALNISHVFHEVDALVQLPHGAFHFGVAFVANHDEVVAFFVHLGHFHMHFGDQRTGGVKHIEAAFIRLLPNGLRHTVRAEHQGCASGHIGQVFDEDGTFGLEVVHHIGVVHDFMADIDRRTKFADGPFNDFNGAVHARAKTPGFGQHHVHEFSACWGAGDVHQSTPIT